MECGRNAICRLTDDLDMVQCPYDKQFGTRKAVPLVRKFFFDLFDRLMHIPEPVLVGSHKGTASCSTVFLKFSWMPFTDATSTSLPSRSESSRCNAAWVRSDVP